jgi:hypothetical protein
MIDCENEVYTLIAQALRAEYSAIDIASEYVKSPSAFPHVSVVMMDNSIMEQTIDSGDHEVAIVMFEINVFSNKAKGKKSECKKIMSIIDGVMTPRNFRRLSMTPVPNMEDASIYRLVARYRAATDGSYFYRR